MPAVVSSGPSWLWWHSISCIFSRSNISTGASSERLQALFSIDKKRSSVATPEQPMNEHESQAGSLIDFQSVTERLRFVLKSVRRHKAMAIGAFTVVVAGAGVGLAVLPKTYRVESRGLIGRDAPLSSVTHARSRHALG